MLEIEINSDRRNEYEKRGAKYGITPQMISNFEKGKFNFFYM